MNTKRTRTPTVWTVLGLLWLALTGGRLRPAQAQEGLLALSEPRMQGTLPYRLFKPAGATAGAKLPLVIYLHGAGQRGTDNVKQVTQWNNMLASLLSAENRAKHPAYVIAPQCPEVADGKEDLTWVASSWTPGSYTLATTPETPFMKSVRDAITALKGEFPIDEDRVYVLGVSMGGFGAWDLVARSPGLVGGLITADGGGPTDAIDKIKDVASLCAHDGDDGTVRPAGDRALYEGIAKAGGRPQYHELSMGNHTSHRYIGREGTNVWDWLFAQRRGVPATALPDVAFAPPGGAPAGDAPIAITTTITGAAIRYTTNGTIPSETTGTAYAAPFKVAAGTTVHALVATVSDNGQGDRVTILRRHAESYAVGTPPAMSGGGGSAGGMTGGQAGVGGGATAGAGGGGATAGAGGQGTAGSSGNAGASGSMGSGSGGNGTTASKPDGGGGGRTGGSSGQAGASGGSGGTSSGGCAYAGHNAGSARAAGLLLFALLAVGRSRRRRVR